MSAKTSLPQARDNLRQAEEWLRDALEGYLEDPESETLDALTELATEYRTAYLALREAEEAEYLTT